MRFGVKVVEFQRNINRRLGVAQLSCAQIGFRKKRLCQRVLTVQFNRFAPRFNRTLRLSCPCVRACQFRKRARGGRVEPRGFFRLCDGFTNASGQSQSARPVRVNIGFVRRLLGGCLILRQCRFKLAFRSKLIPNPQKVINVLPRRQHCCRAWRWRARPLNPGSTRQRAADGSAGN